MLLTNIKISGFRLFETFEMTFNKGLNVLVGENNSGKTALVDAIKYVLETNSGDWIRIRDEDFHNHKSTFTIRLKFEDISPSQAKNFVEHLTHEEAEAHNLKSALYVNLKATKTDTLRREGRFIRTELRSGKNADGPPIERDVRNYLSTTYLKPLRDAEQELAAGKASRLSQILLATEELVGNEDHIEEIIDEIIQANTSVRDNDGIAAARRKIDEEYLAKLIFKTDNLHPIINMVATTPYAEMDDSERKRALALILEKLSLSLHEKNLTQGLGYNNLLFIATELLLLEQEKDDFPILLIEEPESHLHPQLQNKLLSFVKSQTLEKESGLQCILTTHSPNIASQVPLNNLIIMSQGKAFPLREGETALAKEDYIFLEKFLDTSKSNLFFAKGVILVEGAGENILLPTVARLLGRRLEDYGVTVISDIALSRFAKIFKRKDLDDPTNLSKWNPTKVACIRDLDLWPTKADQAVFEYGPLSRLERRPGRRGNIEYWLDGTANQISNRRASRINTIKGQNVEVFISDVWTFEYSLIVNGLAEEVYLASRGTIDGFNDLPTDAEERAIAIFSGVNKTTCAYELAILLEYIFADRPDKLRSFLPRYIVDAIAYVTEPFPAPPMAAAAV